MTWGGRVILFSPTPKRQKPTHCARQRGEQAGRARARGSRGWGRTPAGTLRPAPRRLSHDIRASLASLSFNFRLFICRLKPRANHRMANTSYPAQAYTNCSSTTPFRRSNSSPCLIPMAKCHWRGAAWPRGRLPRPPERACGHLYMCSERSDGSMGP